VDKASLNYVFNCLPIGLFPHGAILLFFSILLYLSLMTHQYPCCLISSIACMHFEGINYNQLFGNNTCIDYEYG
jgi:hypothetical protein